MVEFNGTNTLAYFLPPKNRYGVCTRETFDFTEYDFTITLKVKVDWEKMKPNTPTSDGGIVAKNGRHCGIIASRISEGQCFLKAQFWTWLDREVGVEFHDVWIQVKEDDEIHDVSMIHDKKKKIITIVVDGDKKSISYTGEIIDYRDSWLWLGCNNSLDSCAPEHRGFFHGTIYRVGLYQKVLEWNDIIKTFEYEKYEDINPEHEPCAVFNFNKEDSTPYKFLDISMNGNSLILFDKRWMAEETKKSSELL